MSTNQPDDAAPDDGVEEAQAGPLDEFAAEVAGVVGGSWSTDHGTIKVRVESGRWADAVAAARGLGLDHLEFLGAIDWANDVEVGEPPAEPVEERYEVLCAVGDTTEGRLVVLSTDVDKASATLASVTHVFPGAEWHEREAVEMYGLSFEGLANTNHLYLPDAFEGHPLRKSFALLTREVKPWPGDVDVEDLPAAPTGPSTENPGA